MAGTGVLGALRVRILYWLAISLNPVELEGFAIFSSLFDA